MRKVENSKLSLGKHSWIYYYKIQEILKRADGSIVLWWRGKCLSALHNFIKKTLNSGSAQIQIMIAACRRLPSFEDDLGRK